MVYSDVLERFMQKDPEGYIDGPNDYQALRDNPANRLDPSGTQSGTFGDIAPTTGPTSAPATAPASQPASFLKPNQQNKSFAVTLTNGDTGTLTVTWDKVYAPGPAGKVWPGVKVTFDFKPDKSASNCGKNLTWYQTIHSTVDNAASLDPTKLNAAITSETNGHGGAANPFGSDPVGDNPSGDPTKSYPSNLQSSAPLDPNNPAGPYDVVTKDAPNLPPIWPSGTIVTKNFVTTLCAGTFDKPVGLSVTWSTTQTAGDATKTTISGTVTWGQ